MNLRPIPPAEIAFEWERVRAGLMVVKRATSDDWLPEDVYMAIKTGGAALFLLEDEHGDYLGFVVLKLVPTFHGKRLDIWAAYCSGKQSAMRIYLPKIKELAKQAGAQSIGFSSARPEWGKAAPRIGFKPVQTTYELTL
jgi:hypothetical protein